MVIVNAVNIEAREPIDTARKGLNQRCLFVSHLIRNRDNAAHTQGRSGYLDKFCKASINAGANFFHIATQIIHPPRTIDATQTRDEWGDGYSSARSYHSFAFQLQVLNRLRAYFM